MSKHTKGAVRVASEETVTVRDETDAYICSFGWLKGPHGLGGRRSDAEVIANAYLTAEAFTVATETGLTPRQLADQRKELLEALKEARDIGAQMQRERDEARKLVAEMAAHFAGSAAPLRISPFGYPEWAEHGNTLIRLAKEMTND